MKYRGRAADIGDWEPTVGDTFDYKGQQHVVVRPIGDIGCAGCIAATQQGCPGLPQCTTTGNGDVIFIRDTEEERQKHIVARTLDRIGVK